jgi:Tfp pilus assembly protein PilX
MPLRRKLRAQQGFTTVTLMGVLLVGGLMVAARFATVNPVIGLSRMDQDTKQAYGAAESGMQC